MENEENYEEQVDETGERGEAFDSADEDHIADSDNGEVHTPEESYLELEPEASNGTGKVAVIRKTRKKAEGKRKIDFAKLNINELTNMTISELSSLALEFNTEGTSRMKKQDLIFTIPGWVWIPEISKL